MIVCASITIVYIGSYYVVNMIHVTNISLFMLLILGVFIKCGNSLDIEICASTLYIVFQSIILHLKTLKQFCRIFVQRWQ
jgi:hypothetical protein